MDATAEAQAPAADPGLKKRKLTLANAVDQWAECSLAIEGLTVLRDEAKKVILANAEKTGRRSYKNRIAVVQTGGSLILDQGAVRQMLGERWAEFQTRTKLGWTLKLLK